MTRKKVFISHASSDDHIVPLLHKLIELHGDDPWHAQSGLRAGDLFQEKIDEELAAADVLVVIISHNTKESTWVTTEVGKFQAFKPRANIIPLVLDDFPIENLDRISPGLTAVHAIGAGDCLLDGFERLFAALGRDFLSKVELTNRRQVPDRRGGKDRRTTSVDQRLSVGLMIAYTRATGKSVADATHMAGGDIQALRPIVEDEFSRYLYFERGRRTKVPADRVLDSAFRYIAGGPTDAVEALRALAAHVCAQYDVEMFERRVRSRRLKNQARR